MINPYLSFRRIAVCFAVSTLLSLTQFSASAALAAVNPPVGATGVSSTASVVFSFDDFMDNTLTEVSFYELGSMNALPFQLSWTGQNTTLTCSPQPSWPSGKIIAWTLDSQNISGDDDPVSEAGVFTVGGSGGGGSGTNAVTSFVVGKMHWYFQTSTAAPMLDITNTPYTFQAITSLASNRTASAISVTAPTTVSYGLSSLGAPEFWQYADWEETDLAAFDNKYPAGPYVFNVTAASGGGLNSVTLPSTMAQPNPPRISNFDAAQVLDASQAFTLTWDAFQGGTANDHISVSVGTNFNSPDFSKPNALKGTATSVVIPAGTLRAGEAYSASIMFIRQVFQTNDVVATGAYRSTITDFPIGTKGLTLSGLGVIGGKFGFDIGTVADQVVTIESSSTIPTEFWDIVLVTNAPGTKIRFVDPRAISGTMFYRAR